MEYIISTSRNIVNLKKVERGLKVLQDDTRDQGVQNWIKGQLRKYMIRDFEHVEKVTRMPPNPEPWVAREMMLGNDLYALDIDAMLDFAKPLIEYLASDFAPKNLIRVSVPDAIQGRIKWEEYKKEKAEAERLKAEAEKHFEVLHEQKGYKLVRIKSEEELQREGVQMNHCLGSLQKFTGSEYYYSVRNPQDKPIVSVELRLKDKHIAQIKGKNNMMLSDNDVKVARYFLSWLADEGYEYKGVKYPIISSDDSLNIKSIYDKVKKKFVELSKLPINENISTPLFVNSPELELPQIRVSLIINNSIEKLTIKGNPHIKSIKTLGVGSRLKEVEIQGDVTFGDISPLQDLANFKYPEKLVADSFRITRHIKGSDLPKVLVIKNTLTVSSVAQDFQMPRIDKVGKLVLNDFIRISAFGEFPMEIGDFTMKKIDIFDTKIKNKTFNNLILAGDGLSHNLHSSINVNNLLITKDSNVYFEPDYTLNGTLDASNSISINGKNLTVNGNMIMLDYKSSTILPENLHVKGTLNISGSKQRMLQNLTVDGDLILGKSPIASMDVDTLKVGGKIHAYLDSLKNVPDKFKSQIVWRH